MRDRLVSLLDARISATGRNSDGSELKEFGYWFASAKLPDGWSIDALLRVLDRVRTVEDLRDVVTRLVNLYGDYPGKVAEAVAKLVSNIDKPWNIYSIREPLKELIRRMIVSGHEPLQARAKELIDRLAERGHLEFREMLRVAGT